MIDKQQEPVVFYFDTSIDKINRATKKMKKFYNKSKPYCLNI